MNEQNHNGKGDNVGRDKNIHNYYDHSNFNPITITKELIAKLYTDQEDYVVNHLEVYKTLSNLSNENKDLIQLLSIYLDMFRENITQDHITTLNEIRSQYIETNNSLLNDLSTAMLMGYKSLKDKKIAKEFYTKLSAEQQNKPYVKFVYFSGLATKEELDEFYTQHQDEFTQLNWISVTWGYLINLSFENALEICKKIPDTLINFKEKIEIYCHSCLLSFRNQDKAFASFSTEDFNQAQTIIKSFIPNIQNKQKLSKVDILILCSLLLLVQYSELNKDTYSLFEIYRKHAEYISKVRPNITQILKSAFKIEKEEGDKVISLLIELKPLSENDCFILLVLLETTNLNKNLAFRWLEQCCQINCEEEMFGVFFKLLLKTHDISFWKKHDQQILKEIEQLISKYQDKLYLLRSDFLFTFCQKLLHYGFHNPKYFQCIKGILEPTINKDNGLSAIFHVFLNALLHLKEFDLIQEYINHIDTNQLSFEFIGFYNDLYIVKKEYDEAKKYCDQLVAQAPENPGLWCNKIDIDLHTDRSDEVKSYLLTIPENTFQTISIETNNLITIIALNIDPVFAVQKMINLFIKNPQEVSYPFWELLHKISVKYQWTGEEELSFQNVDYGVTYEENGNAITGLMISSTENIAIIPEFIDKYSELGQIIDQLPVGNTETYNHKNIKILEKKTVISAILNITSKYIPQSVFLDVTEINEILKKLS